MLSVGKLGSIVGVKLANLLRTETRAVCIKDALILISELRWIGLKYLDRVSVIMGVDLLN